MGQSTSLQPLQPGSAFNHRPFFSGFFIDRPLTDAVETQIYTFCLFLLIHYLCHVYVWKEIMHLVMFLCMFSCVCILHTTGPTSQIFLFTIMTVCSRTSCGCSDWQFFKNLFYDAIPYELMVKPRHRHSKRHFQQSARVKIRLPTLLQATFWPLSWIKNWHPPDMLWSTEVIEVWSAGERSKTARNYKDRAARHPPLNLQTWRWATTAA